MNLEFVLKSCEASAKEIDVLTRKVEFESPGVYGLWLSQMYRFLVHATPMLCLAAAKLRKPGEARFHEYMARHTIEELGHERLCQSDIEALGFRPDEFPEFGSTALLYQSQYFQMHEGDALSLLGNILYMEKLSLVAGPHFLERIVRAHGKEKCRLMLVHTNEDFGHVDDVEEIVSHVPHGRLSVIAESVRVSHYAFRAMLLDVHRASLSEIKGGVEQSRWSEVPTSV